MSLTSIIITTHNRPHLLRRAIESARSAGTNVEVIVVDDASTDETESLCRGLPHIKYVRVDRNQRVAGARNIGLLKSSGEYVVFHDDDDLRLPGSLDEQVNLLEANQQAGLVYGQAILGDESARPTDKIYPALCPQGEVFWDLMVQNFIPCGSAVFRRSCLNSVGLLDSDLAGLDDWDLWIRIADRYPIIALEKPVMIWRRSTPVSGQGTSNAAQLVSRAVQRFHSRWKMLPRAVAASSQMRRSTAKHFSTNMAAHLIWETARSLRHREVVQATRNGFGVVQLGPMAVLSLARRSVLARGSVGIASISLRT